MHVTSADGSKTMRLREEGDDRTGEQADREPKLRIFTRNEERPIKRKLRERKRGERERVVCI